MTRQTISYLLSLWRDTPGEQWRATLVHGHTSQQMHFADLALLLPFLLERLNAEAAAALDGAAKTAAPTNDLDAFLFNRTDSNRR